MNTDNIPRVKLTAQVLVREALVLFRHLRRTEPEHFSPEFIPGQQYIAAAMYSEDLELSLDEFSKKFIQPCVTALSLYIPTDVTISSELLLVPKSIVGASERLDGIAMRVILGKASVAELIRFDVRTESR